MPVPAAKHGLALAKQRSQYPGSEIGLPGRGNARREIVLREIEGIFPPGLANGNEADWRIENLSRQSSLASLFQISSWENRVAAGVCCHHEFPTVLYGRNAGLPSQAKGQSKSRSKPPAVLRVKGGLVSELFPSDRCQGAED